MGPPCTWHVSMWIFCSFFLVFTCVFPLLQMWVPADDNSPKLMKMVSCKPYIYVWWLFLVKNCKTWWSKTTRTVNTYRTLVTAYSELAADVTRTSPRLHAAAYGMSRFKRKSAKAKITPGNKEIRVGQASQKTISNYKHLKWFTRGPFKTPI